jgi:hypothetical protein
MTNRVLFWAPWVLSLASCTSARMYSGPRVSEAETANVEVRARFVLADADDRVPLIRAVDGELTNQKAGLHHFLFGDPTGVHRVELAPGERHVEVRLEHASATDRRTLRWNVEAGSRYEIDYRRSERQPPVEAFVVRADTGEELAHSWIAPPQTADFGLDPLRWSEADWRVEDRWHWISFQPVAAPARERLRFEWNEPDRFHPTIEKAWAIGIDLRREHERDYTEFEWAPVSSSDAACVYAWSGVRAGRAGRLHGEIVVSVRDSRLFVARYTSEDAERFAAERETWRAFGLGAGWIDAWKEALP